MKLDPVLIRFNNSTLVHDIALLRLDRPAKRKQVGVMAMTIIMATASCLLDFMLFLFHPLV